MRLDKHLAEIYKDKTRSQITNAIKSGVILVNDKIVKAGYEVKSTDKISGEIKDEVNVTATPEDIKLDIVYEDNYLMVINKPRGMVVHPGAGIKSGTVLNALLGMGNKLERAGIVHRLDKNTAGLLIVAKTSKTQEKLGRMFERHEIQRVYLGLVDGKVRSDITIDKNIIRHPNKRVIFTTATQGGRRAVTHLKVLENYAKHTLCEFRLETGRTHQIRVHCKSINHPIIGDPEYNSGEGQMLEAVKLEFVHPITNKDIKIEIDVTKQFAKQKDKCYYEK